MGREVRRVPKDWSHPSDASRRFKSLYPDFAKSKAEFDDYAKKNGTAAALDYYGNEPDPDDYMPEWPEDQKTHLMMYENTSEGTPISPAFETPEELARWLTDNKASAFGRTTASYEQWLAMIGQGFSMSFVSVKGDLMSGVAAAALPENLRKQQLRESEPPIPDPREVKLNEIRKRLVELTDKSNGWPKVVREVAQDILDNIIGKT